MISRTITGTDQCKLQIREFGSKSAPSIVLIHGWMQSGLSWRHQIESTLANDFHLIVPDLRGHGASDKPQNPEAYATSSFLAEDLNSIIRTCCSTPPVLVGWSMGGKVVGDYLGAFGDNEIAGVFLVGSPLAAPKDTGVTRPAAVYFPMTYDADLSVQIKGVLGFLELCTAEPMTSEDRAFNVAFNMVGEPLAREYARTRVSDYRPHFANLTKPAAFLYGDKERVALPEMCEASAAIVPNADVIVMEGVSHMPFWEDCDRFNTHLRKFMETCEKEAA